MTGGMKIISLDEVIAKRNGSVDPAKFPGEYFELLSIPAFDVGKPEITIGAEIGSTKQVVQEGDVLLSKIVPHIRRAWVVKPTTNHRLIASGEWIVFRDSRFDPNYLRHFLTSDGFHRQFIQTVSGIGGSLLRARPAEVAKIKVPLPPKLEQRRIATILDKADSLHRKRQQALRLADGFLRSTFIDMFGDPISNEKGLPVRLLGNVCRFYAGNSLPDGEPFDGQTGGFLHIKVGDMNLSGNEVDIHIAREWSSRGVGAIIAPAGSILIPKRGGAIATNKKRVLSRPCALDPNLMAIEPGEELRQEVLLEWFKQFDLSSIASGSAVPQLNKGDLVPLKITVPPLEMQDKFVKIAKKVKSLLARQGDQLALIQSASAALSFTLFDNGPKND
jgi:type I restriction enzyme S subunit